VQLNENVPLGQVMGNALDSQAELGLGQAKKVRLRLLNCEQE
jgi:hypothetical protein